MRVILVAVCMMVGCAGAADETSVDEEGLPPDDAVVGEEAGEATDARTNETAEVGEDAEELGWGGGWGLPGSWGNWFGTGGSFQKQCRTVCSSWGGCRTVCSTSGFPGGPGFPGGSELCGTSVCGGGDYCCNASCGICAPIGGACTQQACGGQLPIW